MSGHPKGWRGYAIYLTDQTPLSERQAEIVALFKDGCSKKEVVETLVLQPETIEDHLSDVRDQLQRAQELCTIMGPHPWGDGETREDDQIDDSPWTLRTSGAINYADEERTRLELKLYAGEHNVTSYSYLLVEREIIDDTEYATKTVEKRGAYGPNGLRAYIYGTADTVDEYYLCWALLYKAGVDPGAGCARSVDGVVDRDISPDEADAAKERALERVDRYVLDVRPIRI